MLDTLSAYDLTVTDTLSADELGTLSEDKDVLFSMWCNQAVGYWTQNFPEKKIVTYLRRFELWNDTFMNSIDFRHLDGMIWLNNYYAETFNELVGHNHDNIRHWMIPNGIDLDEWPMRNGEGNPYKIALVASMKHVKNIPLAAAILLDLPKAYHIYHIGLHAEGYTGELFAYIKNLGLKDRWHWEPRIEPSEVQEWLKDKGILLNPSVNEGNPNCVIEAMAMGIKPVIHAWPGAYSQFPEDLIFKTVTDACHIIKNNKNNTPEIFRDWIKNNFSISNFSELHNVINEIMG